MDGYDIELGIPLVEFSGNGEECDKGVCPEQAPSKKCRLPNLNEPYLVTQVLVVWLSVTIVFFAVFNLFEGAFFNLGPGDNVILFGVRIDTWTKWTFVMVFNFIDM